MAGYIIRRLLWGAFAVWVISLVTFAIFIVFPSGDPATRIAGKNPTPEQIEQIREQWHLDESMMSQYWWLMGQLIKGDLTSPSLQVKVVPLVVKAVPVTVSLAMFAVVIWVSVGVAFGIIGARAPGSRVDRSLMIAALAGISIPMAWLALMSLMIWTDKIPIFPAGDYRSIGEGGIFGWAYHLLLPAASLSVVFAGVYARMTRTNVRQAMNEEYIKTARAKGIPERQVWVNHILRTGLIPILVLIGLDIGVLLGGAIFTESIFGLPGLGYVLSIGIGNFDIPVLLTCTIVAAVFVVLSNLIVDVIQAAVDPRIRLS